MKVDTKQNVLENTGQDQEQVEQTAQVLEKLDDGMLLLGRSQDIGAMLGETFFGLFSGKALRIPRLCEVDMGGVSCGDICVGHEMLIDVDMFFLILLLALAALLLLLGEDWGDRVHAGLTTSG